MTYDISLLSVFQTGELAAHIIENDFTASDIVSISHVSKGFNAVITKPELAARFWKNYILASPFQFVPTTVMIQRGEALEVSDNQLVPIEQRHVIRGREVAHVVGQDSIAGREVIIWLHFLRNETLIRNTIDHFPETDERYTYLKFYNVLMSQPDNGFVPLKGLMNYISLDALKSFLSLCMSYRLLDDLNLPGCLNFLREVNHLPSVKEDPDACLYFAVICSRLFVSYPALSDEEKTFKILRDELMQLPGFSFDIFMKVCLQEDYGHTGRLDGIKYLRNFIKLYRAGYIDFHAWRTEIEEDNSLRLHLSTMTDAFVRAVQRGYISCHLDEAEDLFGLFPLLREETELDRQLNQIFEDLCEKLRASPEIKADFRSCLKFLNALFEFIFMNTSQYNLENDLREGRASPLFSRFWAAGELTAEDLYNHLVMIISVRKKTFDSFVSESEILKAHSDLKALFLEDPMVFEFYRDRCDNGLDEVFEGKAETISSLAQLVEPIKKSEKQLIQQVLSTEMLEVLSGLTGSDISEIFHYFKDQDGDPTKIKGFLDFFMLFMNQVIGKISLQESQAIMAALMEGFTRLKPLLGDKYFPICLDLFGCAVQLFFMGSNSPHINALSERFSKIETCQFEQHVTFLRESTLHLLCKSFGSRAATFYFEALSKGDDFIFVKALFMMSLGALTQEQWIASLKTFIRSNYYRERLERDDGAVVWNSGVFTSIMGEYIDKILNDFINGIEIDHKAVFAQVLLPGNDSDDEGDDQEVSSEDSDSDV